ncbi:MAG: peptidylprolyl isomerase [Bacteroidetes bacterium]|nr:peptidylprolyl isomerase [Bacteroidota bacterium]
MKSQKQLLLLLCLFVSCLLSAQKPDDPVLMTIAGKTVTTSEFMNVYRKNNVKGTVIDKKTLEEYLDLYINFRLKVKQAEDLGLDTLPSFSKELKGYREQLARPYMSDEETTNQLLREAYERMKYDLRASHVFIKLKSDASPEDTLAAYKKIADARERIIKGEPFEKVVMEVSEDPASKDREATPNRPPMKGNKGDLGFFTVFDMVYSFETSAYTTPIGQISPIVRSDYGYHILKMTDKIEALGKVTVAHIYLKFPDKATKEDSAGRSLRIDSIYRKLQSGEDFAVLAKKYSDDKGSAENGGILPKFGVNRMVPEFILAIVSLKNEGDYTRPVLTPYGWHIIKLKERKATGTFDEEKNTLRQRISKDVRSDKSRKAVIAMVRKKFEFRENLSALEPFYTLVDTTIFQAQWDPKKAEGLNKVLFQIGDQVFAQKQFADYLGKKQTKRGKEDIRAYVSRNYKTFLEENLFSFYDSKLEDLYPEFRALVKEYRDGILLFDLTDQKVWSKAVKDTTGLKNFYEQNKGNYIWDERLDAEIFTVKDPSILPALKKTLQSGLKQEDILSQYNIDSVQKIKVEVGKYSRGDNKNIDEIKWMKGVSQEIPSGNTTILIRVNRILPPQIKTLQEARGLITADYQNALEKEWINQLKATYPVTVNKEVFNNLK